MTNPKLLDSIILFFFCNLMHMYQKIWLIIHNKWIHKNESAGCV